MNRIATALCAALLATAAHSLVVAATHKTTLRFEGLNAIVLRVVAGKTKEARVILVNSEYTGNLNPHRTIHVPTIEFRAGTLGTAVCNPQPCWRSITPSFTRVDHDGSTWYGWYLFNTRVTLQGTSGDVTVTEYTDVLNLTEWHANYPELGKAEEAIWNEKDKDLKGRVHSRVHINGGELSVETTEVKVEVGSPPVLHDDIMATTVLWEGDVSEVWLNDLVDSKQRLKIPLVTDGTVIRVRNYSVGMAHDKREAEHVEEFYALTNEAYPPRPIKIRLKSASNSPEAFCPPVGLGKP